MMETATNNSEKVQYKLCKEWLFIQNCRDCLFETLCRYKEMKEKNKENTKQTDRA